MRIGLISDTHIPEACEHLPPRVFEVFAGIDLVMHAGDVYVNRVLDELSAIAPVIAALAMATRALTDIATASIPTIAYARRTWSR